MKKIILSLILLAVCVTTIFSYSKGVHDFQTDPTYITSIADVMVSLMQFSSIFKIMALAGDASELYELSLEIDPNHFQSLLGYGLATAYQPEFVGGGMEKALPILKRAEENASEKWEKHLIYLWLSQAYMQLKDAINYEKYITLAENVLPPGIFFDTVKSLNDDESKSMFDTD